MSESQELDKDQTMAAVASCEEGPPVWLDVTRLLWRTARGVLTGIDRVELAYAERLPELLPGAVNFVAYDQRGDFRRLPTASTYALVRQVRPAAAEGCLSRLGPASIGLLAGAAAGFWGRMPAGLSGHVYLNVSHYPLHRDRAIWRLVHRTGVSFVPLLHDLIPLERPEFVKPKETVRHARRLAAVASSARGVLANSQTTAAALRKRLPAELPVQAVPLGVAQLPEPAEPTSVSLPFFVVVGTLEPRKNHALLLQVWQRLAMEVDPPPRLLVIGRRGWGNSAIVNALIGTNGELPHIDWHERVSDATLAAMMRSARALLMPSFAEGFGIPIAEALSVGTPVIASDLPAHREVGGDVPEYLDPCDLHAWYQVILDYCRPESLARQAQLTRLRHWRARSWDTHLQEVLSFLRALTKTAEATQQAA